MLKFVCCVLVLFKSFWNFRSLQTLLVLCGWCWDDRWWFCYVLPSKVLGVCLWMRMAMIVFDKVFLAFRPYARAISRLEWFSSNTLFSISDSTKLCHSIIPFDQGDSAPVLCTFILRASHSVINSSLTNSPPLSVKNLLNTLWWHG